MGNRTAREFFVISAGLKNHFSGGTGWDGAWSKSGDTRIRTNLDGPHPGADHVRLRRNTGYLKRVVDLSGVTNAQLTFRAKVDSFESSDTATVRVSSDGVNFTTVHTFTSAVSDKKYHYYEIDLSGFAMTADLALPTLERSLQALCIQSITPT